MFNKKLGIKVLFSKSQFETSKEWYFIKKKPLQVQEVNIPIKP